MGDTILWRTDVRSCSGQAWPLAVLGMDVGGGRPLPQWGVRGCYPRNIFKFYIAVDEFWCIFMDQNRFCVHSLMIQRLKESYKKQFPFVIFPQFVKVPTFIWSPYIALYPLKAWKGAQRSSVGLVVYSNLAGVVRRSEGGRPSCDGV